MKKLITFLLAIIALSSCQENLMDVHNRPPANNSVNLISVKGDRLAFSSYQAYNEQVLAIANMSPGEINDFETKYRIDSYHKYFAGYTGDQALTPAELEMYNFPPVLQVILNRSREFMIADTIVWLDAGKVHIIPRGDERLLAQIKANPSISNNPGSYLTRLESSEKLLKGILKTDESMANAHVVRDINNGYLDARWQYQFNKNSDPNSIRKDVFETYTTFINVVNYSDHYDYNAFLYLRMKLEWKGSGGWKVAGDPRYTNWNLEVTTYLSNVFNNSGCPQTATTFPSASGIYARTISAAQYGSSDITIQLAGYGPRQWSYAGSCSTGVNGYPKWQIDITGTVYQYITDDVSSYANTFYAPSISGGVLY